MDKPAMDVTHAPGAPYIQQPPMGTVLPGALPRGPLKHPGLELSFVTRMSRELGAGVADAARAEGITAGAWVRRVLMERLALRSSIDHRSGRPIHRPAEDTVVLVAAIRALGDVGHALSSKDVPAARASLATARETLLPLVARGPAR